RELEGALGVDLGDVRLVLHREQDARLGERSRDRLARRELGQVDERPLGRDALEESEVRRARGDDARDRLLARSELALAEVREAVRDEQEVVRLGVELLHVEASEM